MILGQAYLYSFEHVKFKFKSINVYEKLFHTIQPKPILTDPGQIV